jgi:hypothetical protein
MILRGESLRYILQYLKFYSGRKSKGSSSQVEYLKILMKAASHFEVAYYGTAQYGF